VAGVHVDTLGRDRTIQAKRNKGPNAVREMRQGLTGKEIVHDAAGCMANGGGRGSATDEARAWSVVQA
jgi:hypothetical protein